MDGTFSPDLFSDSTPRFHDAAPKLATAVSAMLRARYPGLGAPSGMRQSGAMEINSSNFLVEIGRIACIVKRWPALGDAELDARRSQAALANWLAGEGVAMPALLPSADGELVVAQADRTWCVLEYVDGDYFSGEGGQLLATGYAIVELFQALRRVPSDRFAGASLGEPPPPAHELLAALDRDRSVWKSAFGAEDAALLSDAWPHIMAALSETVAAEAQLRASVATCHIDLHPHNVLVRDGSVAALLDFPSLLQAPTGPMLAFGLFKLLRQAIVARGGSAPDAQLRAQRDQVVGALAASGMIGDGRPATLTRLAKTEILRRLSLIVQLNVEKRNREWNHVLPIQARALAEADVAFS